jgi:predicted 3-demethylubiquinone-9 3-methyltransferase (glyoxalase superfamily)
MSSPRFGALSGARACTICSQERCVYAEDHAIFVVRRRRRMALNGGPAFKFSPAISFSVICETQEEVDDLWEKLSAGGELTQCGWLKDKFGVSWQMIPKALGELLGDKDPQKSQRVMNAMMKMVKIDVAALRRAYEGNE